MLPIPCFYKYVWGYITNNIYVKTNKSQEHTCSFFKVLHQIFVLLSEEILRIWDYVISHAKMSKAELKDTDRQCRCASLCSFSWLLPNCFVRILTSHKLALDYTKIRNFSEYGINSKLIKHLKFQLYNFYYLNFIDIYKTPISKDRYSQIFSEMPGSIADDLPILQSGFISNEQKKKNIVEPYSKNVIIRLYYPQISAQRSVFWTATATVT